MPTLLLRLAGPMQSWGTQSRFSIRDTGLEPSKSGVIGLLCAALGKPRFERAGDGFPTLAQLAALKMGVRVDREGVMKRDFHTAGGTHRPGDDYGVIKADGKTRGTVISQRWYLSDASFLVGLETDDRDLLARLQAALARPRWQLSLGRKSFVPGSPVHMLDGLCEESLQDALETCGWEVPGQPDDPERRRLIIDSPDRSGDVRQDVPVSFSERRFTIRYVRTDYISVPKGGSPDVSLETDSESAQS
jgi:CRISPR system Cascade subunit CasD